MIFGTSKRKKEQAGSLQTYLQAEDDVFHRTIIALERLESYLFQSNNKIGTMPIQTAVGSSRDLHNPTEVFEEEYYYLELGLQCKSLYMCANYDNPEVFKVAVESFMKNLLEWYAGRSLLEFYDAVDTAIIPLMNAVTHKANNIDELFDKYVYKTPDFSNESVEDKYIATKKGVNSWLKAQHILEHESRQHSHAGESEIITSHFRGSALAGYKRIVAALSYLCESSAPLKMFVKMVNEFLPEVTSQMPGINEDSIDQMYEKRNNPEPVGQSGAMAEHHNEPTTEHQNEPTAEPFDINFEWDNNLSVNQIITANQDKASEKIEHHPGEVKDSALSKEERFERIRLLANEILELVKSIEEEK